MRINFVLNPDFESYREQLLEMLKDFDTQGEYVTKGKRNTIKKISVNGTVFNTKQFKNPGWFNAFVYKYLRAGKAKRSYEYANYLIKSGLQTPTPVAYYEELNAGLGESFYISVHLEYDFDFRDLIHNPGWPERELILRQMTAFTYKLHENQIVFQDHSPGNTLIKKESPGSYQFYLIDLNRMRFKKLSLKERLHNFRRLWLSKTMIRIMAKEYASLYGASPQLTEALLSESSRSFQRKKIKKKRCKQRFKKMF